MNKDRKMNFQHTACSHQSCQILDSQLNRDACFMQDRIATLKAFSGLEKKHHFTQDDNTGELVAMFYLWPSKWEQDYRNYAQMLDVERGIHDIS